MRAQLIGVLVAALTVAVGCGGGESASSQCDKLFVHMAKVRGKTLEPGSDTYKTDMSKFRSQCVDKLNAKTRSCMLGAQTRDTAKDCLKYIDDKAGTAKELKRYSAKSKTTEARQYLKKLYDGARMYYMSEHMSPGSMTPMSRTLPGPSQGPTPALGTCCKNAQRRCEPRMALWQSPVWTALGFSVDGPSYYSYSYIVDDKSFTARANGDLDCDGVYSTFELHGTLNKEAGDGLVGSGVIMRVNELE